MSYPETIEQTALKLADTTQEITTLRERMNEIEIVETLDIAAAKNGEGKPLYSNETTRSAALALRLVGNEDYTELKETLARAERKRQELTARLERLRGEFKLYLVERQAVAVTAAASASAFV